MSEDKRVKPWKLKLKIFCGNRSHWKEN